MNVWTMLYFALAAEPWSEEGEPCSVCGRPASIKAEKRLLCSTCALAELVADSEEELPVTGT